MGNLENEEPVSSDWPAELVIRKTSRVVDGDAGGGQRVLQGEESEFTHA